MPSKPKAGLERSVDGSFCFIYGFAELAGSWGPKGKAREGETTKDQRKLCFGGTGGERPLI